MCGWFRRAPIACSTFGAQALPPLKRGKKLLFVSSPVYGGSGCACRSLGEGRLQTMGDLGDGVFWDVAFGESQTLDPAGAEAHAEAVDQVGEVVAAGCSGDEVGLRDLGFFGGGDGEADDIEAAAQVQFVCERGKAFPEQAVQCPRVALRP